MFEGAFQKSILPSMCLLPGWKRTQNYCVNNKQKRYVSPPKKA